MYFTAFDYIYKSEASKLTPAEKFFKNTQPRRRQQQQYTPPNSHLSHIRSSSHAFSHPVAVRSSVALSL
jgi:hypothetical protein